MSMIKKTLRVGNRLKLEGQVPDEFLAEMVDVQTTHASTLEAVKYMDKMIRAGQTNKKNPFKNEGAQPMDELIKLGKTCEKSMHLFYEQRYYYVLQTIAEACGQLSRIKRQSNAKLFEQSLQPMKLWVDEDYPHLVKEMQSCHKAKKDLDASSAAQQAASTPAREKRLSEAQEKHDLVLSMCKSEIEKTRQIRKHHNECLKNLAIEQYSMSKQSVETLTQALAQLQQKPAGKAGDD